MTALRVAIVGFGKIARDQHVPAIAATDGVTLAAVASRNASLPDLPHFTALEALLRDGPPIDAVALCTPPQVRRAQAATALAAGKHVMLEKPPGASVSELDPLIAAARAPDGRCSQPGIHALRPRSSRRGNGLRRAASSPCIIDWKEDVRVWHPGQGWIWEPGGLGVFDPGINALSILTRILPQPLFVTAAELSFPANREAPIAARLSLTGFRRGADRSRIRLPPDRPAELGHRRRYRPRSADALRRRRAPRRRRRGAGRSGGGGISRALSPLYRVGCDGQQRRRPDAASPRRGCLPARPPPDRRKLSKTDHG